MNEWFNEKVAISLLRQDANLLFTLKFHCLRRLDKSQHPIFSALMWSIRKHKNNKVWNDITKTCQSVCDRASTLFTSWTNAQIAKTVLNPVASPRENSKWSKPSSGQYKCNVDASFSESLNRVGIDICIRDDQGAFVLART